MNALSLLFNLFGGFFGVFFFLREKCKCFIIQLFKFNVMVHQITRKKKKEKKKISA